MLLEPHPKPLQYPDHVNDILIPILKPTASGALKWIQTFQRKGGIDVLPGISRERL